MSAEAPTLQRSAQVRAGAALRPAATVRRLALGDRTALFCERRQQLFELNTTADAIWCGLTDGFAPGEVAHDLGAQGEAFVDACLAAWLDAGLLVPVEVLRRAQILEVTFPLQIGGFAASLALDDMPDLRGELEAVFGQFAGGPGGLRLSVVGDGAGLYLLADGAPLGRFASDRIVPEVKAVLTDGLARATGDGAFLLHAALLSRGDGGLLITGAPGAGKTTLTLALAANGFGYGGDDILRVGANGALAALPFSPAVKSGAWPLVGTYFAGLGARPVHLRGDGQQARYLPVRDLPPAKARSLRWVVSLDRRAGAEARLKPVEPLAMLGELLAGALSADRAARATTLAALARQLDQAACLRLTYCDLAQAVARLTSRLDG